MKTITTSALLLLGLFLASCDENQFEMPKSSFDAPFPKPNRDLSEVLGSHLVIRSGQDTLDLRIRSTAQHNLITETHSGDTIFYGSVSQFRGLYYFSQPLSDTACWIYAVRITDHLIYGLGTGWQQMLLVDEAIERGLHPKLVKSRHPDQIRLQPHKRELRKLFAGILPRLQPDTILTQEFDRITAPVAEAIPEPDHEAYALLARVYPNPVRQYCTVELTAATQTGYVLTDQMGNIVQRGQFTERSNRLDVGSLAAGLYILTLNDPLDQHQERLKLIRQ